jgi:hypothetical protein
MVYCDHKQRATEAQVSHRPWSHAAQYNSTQHWPYNAHLPYSWSPLTPERKRYWRQMATA